MRDITFHLIRLFLLVGVTAFCASGQNISIKDISQDSDIARHEMKIAQIEDRAQSNSQRIDRMVDSVNELKIEIAQAKYAVYGFGFALTLLQVLQVLTAFKKPKEPRLKDRY